MDVSKLRVSRHSKPVRKMGCNTSTSHGVQHHERRQTTSSRPEIGKSAAYNYCRFYSIPSFLPQAGMVSVIRIMWLTCHQVIILMIALACFVTRSGSRCYRHDSLSRTQRLRRRVISGRKCGNSKPLNRTNNWLFRSVTCTQHNLCTKRSVLSINKHSHIFFTVQFFPARLLCRHFYGGIVRSYRSDLSQTFVVRFHSSLNTIIQRNINRLIDRISICTNRLIDRV